MATYPLLSTPFHQGKQLKQSNFCLSASEFLSKGSAFKGRNFLPKQHRVFLRVYRERQTLVRIISFECLSILGETLIQLNFNGSNTFGTIKISSRQG